MYNNSLAVSFGRGVILVGALICLSFSCSVPGKRLAEPPHHIEGSALEIFLSKSASTISLKDAEFYNDTLFVASTIGLLEVDNNGGIRRIYKWYDGYSDEVGDLSVDYVSGDLWIYHFREFRFSRMDLGGFTPVDLPGAGESRFTRADVEKGFRGMGSYTRFWIQGSGRVWEYEHNSGGWVAERLPGLDCLPRAPSNDVTLGCFKTAVPTSKGLIGVFHSDLGPFENARRGTNLEAFSDRLYRLGDQVGMSIELPADHSSRVIAREIISDGNRAVLWTFDGNLFETDGENLRKITSPPASIGAIALSRNGSLYAYAQGTGILRYDGSWALAYPTSHLFDEQDVKLAADNETLALYSQSKLGTEPSTPRLWIFRPDKVSEVSFR